MTRKAWKAATTLGAILALAGCESSFGPDLTGLWIAASYEFRSGSGQVVDVIERDGATYSLTVSRTTDGRRLVTARFDDGGGGVETANGEVFIDDGTFAFETVVYRFTRSGDELILEHASSSFDFGNGSESATLTIRLTQL